jgi:hypothetical protein
VGSSYLVQSLLPFKRFVNPICSASQAANPCVSIQDENVSAKVEVAYDCAAIGGTII